MKKRIVIALSLVLLCSLVSCGTDSNKSPSLSDVSKGASSAIGANSTASSQTEQPTASPEAAAKKLNVRVPDGWNAVTGSVLEHQYMKNTASFMVKTENFSSSTLDEVVVEAEEIFNDTFSKYEAEGTPETITVAGYDARKIVFTCQVSSFSMKYMYVYFFVDADLYAVTFGDIQSTFDSLSGDYQAILDAMTIE